MAQDRSGNIFDEASRRLSKKKKPAAGATPPAAEKPTAQETPVVQPNREVQEMLDKMRTMQKDLDFKIEELQQKSGMAPEVFQNYIKKIKDMNLNLSNHVQGKKSELEQKVWGVLGENAKQAHEKSKEPPTTKPLTEKERKGKTIGARRNWIPMR